MRHSSAWDENPTTIFEKTDEITAVEVRLFEIRAKGTARRAAVDADGNERPVWAEGVVPRPRRLKPFTPHELELALSMLDLDDSTAD